MNAVAASRIEVVRMDSVVNLAVALRLSYRMNRRGLFAAVLAVLACMFFGTLGLDGLYPTAAQRSMYAAVAGDLTAQIALQGPPDALTELGGIAAYEVGWYLAIAVGLINIVVVIRNTRAQEAFGRLELLRAGRFGVHANSMAVLILALGADLLIALGVVPAMIAAGADAQGALAFGAALGGVGAVFAAFALLAAQVTEQPRGAYGIACAALGVAYLLRALGDVSGNPFLRMAAPLGWVQQMHPFGATRWWPLAVCAVAVVLLAGLALRVEALRDHGAGLAPTRPGAATAGAVTRTPLGVALRIHRAGLYGWAAVLLGLGVGFGSAGVDLTGLAAGTQGMLNLLAGFNVNVVDGFLAMVTMLVAIATTGAAIATVLRIRTEELAGRADLLLAGRLPRWRFAATHLGTAVGASVLLLALSGFGIGAVHGARSGDLGQIPRVTVAALAQLPAVLLCIGLTILCIGLRPAACWLVWVLLAESAIVTILGPTMRLPAAVMNLSLFHHVPHLPGVAVNPLPSAVLCVGAIVATALGIAGFMRRDLA